MKQKMHSRGGSIQSNEKQARRGAADEPNKSLNGAVSEEAKEYMTAAAKKAAKVPTKPYEPTPDERDAIQAQLDRRQRRKPAPSLKIKTTDGTAVLSLDHPDQGTGGLLLMEATGSADYDFLDGLLSQVANAALQKGVTNEKELNFLLSVVKSIEPRDELDAMLAAQMAATHVQVMTFTRRLNHVENIPQQDSAERTYNKLCRTFATQVEALKRYRSGGEQTVRVEHVTVNQGGQAIVGSVTTGGRGSPQKPETTR
jgi:hypothetical protein